MIRGLRSALWLLPALLLASPAAGAGNKLSLAERAGLQAAMQRHIDAALVDNAYLYLDGRTGEVRRVHPAAAHPIILRMGEHFVLCTDFRDGRGQPVNIDFYMARRGTSYIVFHVVADDDTQLHALMAAGKVEQIN